MLHLSMEDTASIVAVVGMLERQASNLDASSKIAPMWREWAELLRPTADEQTAQTDLRLAS